MVHFFFNLWMEHRERKRVSPICLSKEVKNYAFLFFLEPTVHCMAYYGLGYSVIGHVSNYKLISKIIPNLYERNKDNICVSLKCGEGAPKKHEFTEVCKEYLDIHSQEIIEEDMFSLPFASKICSDTKSSLESPFTTILKTMKSWCSRNCGKGNLKGFVINDQNSELPINILENDKNGAAAERSLHETIIAYSPVEKVIFLIRKAKDNKNIQNEMKLSTNDITKFLLLYNDVLTKSGVKVINLLVTDDKVDDNQWICEFCKHQIISLESLSSPDVFQIWWEKKSRKFEISFIYEYINRNFIFEFFAKSFGFFALYHFPNILPSISNDPVALMTERILLTPEQIRIVYSTHKHLMIKGCYGSGKSTVGRIKAEMLCMELKEKEALYYVLYDSKSEPVAEIRPFSKIRQFCNKCGLKLMDIIDEIVKDNQTKEKINLVVDGMNSEDLDEKEAEKINKVFATDEKFRDSTIFLIFQPLEKERIVSSIARKKDMASLLKSMKVETLTYIMRTTIEINNLVRSTIDTLKDQITVFPAHEPSRESSELYLANNMQQKKSTQDAGYCLNLTAQKINKEEIEDIGEVAKFSTKNESCLTETVTCRRNTGIEEAEDIKKNWQDKSYDDRRKFTLDAVSEYLMSTSDKSSTSNIATSKFQYFESNKSGNNIHSEIPNLYEICYPEESREFKILLISILRKVMSEKVEFLANDNILRFDDVIGIFSIKKHVILHFNAEDDIPELFYTVFKLMGILQKVTVKYEEFRREMEKKILICSYRSFRGLEYPRVIVAVDRSVCLLKHYLPELLTRSTSFLHIIALKEVNHVKNGKLDRTLDKILGNWKNPMSGPPLVKQWKIGIIDSGKEFTETSQSAASGRSDEISIRIQSNVCRELEKEIGNILTTKIEVSNQVR